MIALLSMLLGSPLAAEDPAAPALPAKSWELELGAEDPVLGERGPSRSVTYEVKPSGPLTTVYVHAESKDLDPYLRVEDARDGTVKLLGEDDNSGGGKTAFVELEIKERTALRVTVASAEAKKGGKLSLRVVEAHESETQMEAAAAAEKALAEVEALRQAGELAEAREKIRSIAEKLLRGSEGSARVAAAAWRTGFRASRLGEARVQARCWGKVLEFRETTLPDDHPDLQKARQNFAVTLKALGDLPGAKALEEKVLEVRTRTLPDDHPDLQRARGNFAATLKALGDLLGAKALEEKVLEVLARTLPDDHPDLQRARGNFAGTLKALGDLPGAKALEEKVLEVRTRTLPDDHLDLQRARGNFAGTLAALGDLPGAKALEEKVLEVRTRTLPDEHPDLQAARGNFAVTLKALGDLAGAKALEEKVLEVRTRTLPEGHPDLQRARGSFAATLAELGDLAGAKALFEKVLEVRTRTLPDDHPDLQAARLNVAATLAELGDLPGAKALQEKVLEVLTRTFPDDHPDLQRARGNFAATLKALGDLRGAKALEEKVLEVRTRTLPDDHPDLQAARLNFAVTLKALGDLPGAKALEEKVLEVRTRTFPDEHPDLQAARGNFAVTLKALGDLPGAKALEEKVLEVRTRTFPDEHPDLQAARGNFAATLKALGDLPGAKALEEKVLEVLARTLPDEHPDLQAARGNFAATLRALGDIPGAKALEEKVLEVRTRTLPDDHPDLQAARGNFAATLAELGDLAGAKALFEKVLEVFTRTLPDDHPDLQAARGNFAVTLRALGDLAGAKALFEKVLEVRTRTLPEGHPSRTLALGNLAWTLAGFGDAARLRDLLVELARGTRRRVLDYEAALAPRQAGALGEEALGEVSSVLSLLSVAAKDAEARGALEREALSLVETLRGAAGSAARLSRLKASAPEAEQRALERLRSDAAVAAAEISRLAHSGAKAEAIVGAVGRKEAAERRLTDRLRRLPGAATVLAEATVERLARSLEPAQAAVGFWRYTHASVRADEPGKYESAPRYLAFVLRAGGSFRRVDLGPAERIEHAVAAWRAALGTPLASRGLDLGKLDEEASERTRRLGDELRRFLLDPVLESAGDAKEILVALDGALHLVPLDALPLGDGLAGDKLAVRVVTSLRGLGIDAGASLAPPRFLAFGGIDYAAEFASPAVATAAWVPRGAPVEVTRSAGWGSGFQPLLASEAEARLVAKHFRSAFPEAPEPEVLVGAKASKAAFLDRAPQARFVHLATHGWFAPESVPSQADERPLAGRVGLGSFADARESVRGFSPLVLCGLALAGANLPPAAGGHVEGVITAEEISGLDLSSCELVVLSACETNVGLERAGKGIASLQEAVHAAGARTAVTSLWRVPDEATRELMGEFYRRVWVLKEPKWKALWEAKKKLRGKRDRASGKPVHGVRDWAGWVLSGEG